MRQGVVVSTSRLPVREKRVRSHKPKFARDYMSKWTSEAALGQRFLNQLPLIGKRFRSAGND
ncbi:hypothetical protein RMSM_03780 [Rhodopirellula maiorica SM1]|uniref:Uncharacterized protein n=1 Tax=Rhodopirellula maiorica SM1 TaxID=1265738 RepID=M5RJA6_9BACT|nr:hypothetical protein RMSM_03780 [Rhodopirellula maiorica SM1]